MDDIFEPAGRIAGLEGVGVDIAARGIGVEGQEGDLRSRESKNTYFPFGIINMWRSLPSFYTMGT
jgi:hypothetical protein